MLYNTFFTFWQVLGKIKSNRFDFLDDDLIDDDDDLIDDDDDLIDDDDLSNTEEYCKCNLCTVFRMSYLL